MKKTTNRVAKLIAAAALAVGCSITNTQGAIVAKWSFDEVSGQTAHDSVRAFNGTLSPTGATFVSGGVSGGAVQISKASNGFVSMGDVLGLTSGDFTLVAWLKTSAGDQTPDSALLGKHAAFSRNGYLIHLNQSTGLAMQSANKVFFYQGGTGVGQLMAAETPVSTSVVNDGQWHQVVAVYRAGGMKSIYVDGAPAEQTKVSQSFVGNSVAFLIGGVSEHGIAKSRLNGTVDEVQIYNHALTDADIDYLYQNPTAVILDCEQKALALEQELAHARATIENLQNQLEGVQSELHSVDQSLSRLNSHLQELFRNPRFEIKGTSPADVVDNLVRGIEQSNRGNKQNLYQNLLTQP